MIKFLKKCSLLLDKNYVLNNTDYMAKHFLIKTVITLLCAIPYCILISIILIKLFNI